jgi:TPR repeat protein
MPLDPAQAVTWYREAAEAGNAVAISAIGRVQEQGAAGLQKSNDDAMTWYRSAAQAVDAEAMYKLAEMLSNIPLGLFGRGDKLKEIFDWYGRAANAGHPLRWSRSRTIFHSYWIPSKLTWIRPWPGITTPRNATTRGASACSGLPTNPARVGCQAIGRKACG